MKFFRNYLVLGLLSLGLLTSCDKDDDDIKSVTFTEEQLAGTWNLTGLKTENGRTTTTIAGETTIINFTNVGSDFAYKTVFGTNPNIMKVEGKYTVATTTSVNGVAIGTETTTIDSTNFEDNLLSGSWELANNGTELKTTTNGETTTAKIIEFTENKLIYSIDLSTVDIATATDVDTIENLLEELGDFSVEAEGNTIITLTR